MLVLGSGVFAVYSELLPIYRRFSPFSGIFTSISIMEGNKGFDHMEPKNNPLKEKGNT